MRTIRKTTKSQRTPTTEIRGLILDASKRIIEEDGYDAFTIRLLSEKADVSPRASTGISATSRPSSTLSSTTVSRRYGRSSCASPPRIPCKDSTMRESYTAGTPRRRPASTPCCGDGMRARLRRHASPP